jgi:DNA-binding transcriptional regulator YiaG
MVTMEKRWTNLERVLDLNRLMDKGEHVALRVRNHVPQAVIADTIGVSHGCISRYEALSRRPTGRVAVAYHRALCAIAEAEAKSEAA